MRQMIKQGDCYADNGSAEEMKEQRDNGIDSKFRENSAEFNMERFDEMLNFKTEKWEKDDQG